MKTCLSIFLVALLALTTACSPQPSTLSPTHTGAPGQAPSLVPLGSETNGVSPTQALSDTTIPRRTEIVVRLESTLSTTRSHPGDTITAVLDKPIAVKGEVLVSRGAKVYGRVVSVHAASTHSPAFLRLTLSSVEVAGRNVALHTSAVFAKGILPSPSSVAGSEIASALSNSGPVDQSANKSREVEFSTGRKLTFWLVQASPL